MSVIEILGVGFGIVSFISVFVYYVMIYSYTAKDAAPQFYSILGSVLIGSIIFSILAYLALIQQNIVTQQLIVAILLFVPIVMACIAFSISA